MTFYYNINHGFAAKKKQSEFKEDFNHEQMCIRDSSMVAGFVAGWMEKKDYEHAFHMGIAAGSASAFSENLATKEEIEAVYGQITGK